ncbi:MAG: hypothetical protein NVSMB56_11660 [Pyrinomonadaceae bacterium]
MKFTEADYDAITDAVERAEAKSAAEIIVVVRKQSGSYRDVCYLCGAGLAFAGLLFVLYSPYDIYEFWIPFDLIVLFALGACGCALTPLRRWLTSEKRRERQIGIACAAAFIAEKVGTTRAHTGVLIYFSMLERRIELLPDTGVLQSVPTAEWRAFLPTLEPVARARRPTAQLVERIDALGELMGRFMPATADKINELPNRPRTKNKDEGGRAKDE